MNQKLFHCFILKYAEIGVKGRNRYLFEDALVSQIQRALNRCEGEFFIRKTPGRIYAEAAHAGEGFVPFDYDEVVEALKHIFGIVWICPVVVAEDEGIERLRETAADYFAEMYSDRNVTFKVEARRSRKNYPLDSMEIGASLGEAILAKCPNQKVDVHHPEVLLEVEVRDHIYLYSEHIPGPGGMPLGTSGKAMLLLSGGIDSPVAGWMVAKRGVTLDAVYFHAPPYTSERAKQKVVDLAKLIAPYTGPIRLHVIQFTQIQMAIYEKCPHDELTIIMRRYMMRIAEHLAREAGALGLVTGESIGQVASQTLSSLAVTNEVCSLPVYRPLVAFDKQEIVELSEKIGTYETSILPYEDCCTIFVAKHPVTKPNPNVIRRHEGHLGEEIGELLEQAYASDEVIEIAP